jgi:general secretion pathway protein D
MSSHKNRVSTVIFLLALGARGITAAGVAQEPEHQQEPAADEERRKVFERLVEQMRKKAQEQPGQAPAQQQAGQPAAQQTTVPQPASQQAGQPSAQQEPAPVPAQQQPAAAPAVPAVARRAPLAGNQVQLAYDNADLYEFVNQIADTLGITPIIIDPDVKGSVTIHSSAPMAREDVFPLFNLILKNNNAALVKQGNIYQVVPTSSAIKKGLEIIDHLPPVPQEQPTTAADASQPPATKPAADQPQTAPPPAAGRPGVPPAPPQEKQKGEGESTVPRLQTHVIRVEFVPIRDLVEPLKLFMTEGSVIMPYERLNMLIATDYGDSISKILEVIRMLDNAYIDPDLIELIKIKYNASTDVVDDLKKIFGGGAKDSATGISFVSLDRLNAILVQANSRRALGEVKRWIQELDAPSGRSVQTFVYTVENGTAANIAMILGALYGGEGGGAGGAGTGGGLARGGGSAGQAGVAGDTTRGTAPYGGGYGGYGGGYGGGGYGGYGGGGYGGYGGSMFGGGGYGGYGGGGYGGSMFGGGGYGGYGGGGGYGGFGSFGGGSMLGPRLNQGGGMFATILRGGAFTGLQDAVRIVVDELNNTLIVQSSAADYAYILETIKKLDIMPRQAIIDARLFEVDLNDTFSLGIAATLQKASGNQNLTTATLSGESGALGIATFAMIGSSRELLMTLAAVAQKTKVRVLEAPSVLALDGTMARIVVGGELPYTGASYVPATGGATTSIQYRETGIQLLVVPRISASGTVTMDLAQEVSAPGSPTNVGGQSQATFTKTSVSTTLAVKDGDTVAIAGLIRTNQNQGRLGIPVISNLPLIGGLFGSTSRSSQRTELLIMITPHVVRTPDRLREMTQTLKDSLRNVRKEVDGFSKEILEDREDAQEDRVKQQQQMEKQMEKQRKKQEKAPAPVVPEPEPPNGTEPTPPSPAPPPRGN